ncbi:ParB/RepB/Spo0J family partition protein [Rhizobiales bacterium GAS191]|nr:ParB/RepB/Spo0J family partition protein [Rhizobiales bacterium GAS191]
MIDEALSIRSRGAGPTTAKGAAMFESNTEDVALSDISVSPDRLRSPQPKVVDEIAESFEKVGQLQPIVVRAAAGPGEAVYRLISGRHRLEAARKLGWDSIRAQVLEGFDDDHARLAEIDENLIRGELSAAETAAHQAERKAIYLRTYPETKAGGDRRSKSHGETSKKPAYIDAAAAEIGRSRATIAREVNRGEKIPDVAAIAGTSLDKEGELDALAKLPADQQAPLIEQAKAGEKVTAKASKAVKAKRKEKAEERQAQDGPQQEEERKAGDERTHPAIAYLREHLSAEQIAEFVNLVEQPNCPGCWSEFGEALAGEPEIRKLLEGREATPDSDDEQEQAASLGEEEAPRVAA